MADTYTGPALFGTVGPKSGNMKAVKGLVIHHTGGRGTTADVISTLKDRTAEGVSVGSTYVMERDGTVFRIVPEGARTWHASGYNSNFEGIEVIANDDGDITPEQVEGFRTFASWHASNYGYTAGPTTVFAHGEVSTNKRQTEGATLKWTYLQSQGFTVPAGVMVGDKGDGRPGMKFADAAPWIRRPPGDIPDVASEIDLGVPMPRPRPSPLSQIAMQRATIAARDAVLNSAAMYGVRAPGADPNEAYMTPDQNYGIGHSGVVSDLSLMEMMRPQTGGMDDIGAGPSSWFGPDMSIDGLGGRAFVPAGALALGGSVLVPDAPPMPPVPFPALARPDPVPMPRPRPTPAAPAAPPVPPAPDRQPATPNNPGMSADFVRDVYEGIIAPTVAPTEDETRAEQRKSSMDRLRDLTASVYAGKVVIDNADDGSLEGGVGLAGGPAPRPPTVIPSTVNGRWMIDPTSIAQAVTLTPPKLNSSIAFSMPTGPLANFDGSKYAGMASAFRNLSVPAPATKPAAPAPSLSWQLLDSPSWDESMERRDAWVRSTTVQTVRAPTVDETRAEQNLARKKPAAPSTATINPAPGVKAGPPAPPPTSVVSTGAKTITPPKTSVPSTKPTYRTVQVVNPEFSAWEKKYGTTVAPRASGVSAHAVHNAMRAEEGMGKLPPPPPVAPPPPPAPPRYIDKKVLVAPVAGAAPQPIDGAGLYRIQAGDTLGAISRRSGVSIAELQRLNGIADPNKIIAGQSLRIGAGNNAIPMAGAPKAGTPPQQSQQRTTGSNNAAPPAPMGSVMKGSSTGRDYVVGKVYVNSQGVSKVLMPDGSFKAVS